MQAIAFFFIHEGAINSIASSLDLPLAESAISSVTLRGESRDSKMKRAAEIMKKMYCSRCCVGDYIFEYLKFNFMLTLCMSAIARKICSTNTYIEFMHGFNTVSF